MGTYTIASDYRCWCVTSRTLTHDRTQEEAPLPDPPCLLRVTQRVAAIQKKKHIYKRSHQAELNGLHSQAFILNITYITSFGL